MSVRNQGGQGMLFRLVGPLIAPMVGSRFRGDLEALQNVFANLPASAGPD